MLYTKLPTSAIDFDDSVNGGVYGKYRPVSAYFWQCSGTFRCHIKTAVLTVLEPSCVTLKTAVCVAFDYCIGYC